MSVKLIAIGRLKDVLKLEKSVSSSNDEVMVQFYINTVVNYKNVVVQCLATDTVAEKLYESVTVDDVIQVFGHPTEYELTSQGTIKCDIKMKVDSFNVLELETRI